jgi:hypothetical protein
MTKYGRNNDQNGQVAYFKITKICSKEEFWRLVLLIHTAFTFAVYLTTL